MVMFSILLFVLLSNRSLLAKKERVNQYLFKSYCIAKVIFSAHVYFRTKKQKAILLTLHAL